MSGDGGLIDLLAAIRSEHDRFATKAGQSPQVLAVTHDALAGDWAVLRSIFERLDGKLYRIDSDSPLRLPGNPGSVLRETIRASCASAGADEIEITLDGGMVSVGSSAGADHASESMQMVRGTIARILSYEVAERSLVGISVPFGLLDDAHQGLVWDLLVRQAPNALSGQIGTFVPIVDGAVQPRRHCTGTPSLRFAISRAAFHKRLRQSPAGSAIEECCPSLHDPLVVFLAAGASASANIPTGDTVRDEALARLLPEQAPRSQLAEQFRAWLYERRRFLADERDLSPDQFARSLTLERVLREEFHVLETSGRTRADSQTLASLRRHCERAVDRHPEGRSALREIIEFHPRLILVTVNLDWQIEDSLTHPHELYKRAGGFGDAEEHVRSRIAGDPPDPRTPILKIHGSIEDPDSLIADVDLLEMGLAPDVVRALAPIFDASAEPIPWIWVGSSMRDRDVNRFLRRMPEPNEWWVDVLPGPGLDDFVSDVRKDQHPTTKGRLITELADEFLPKLARRVRELSAGE